MDTKEKFLVAAQIFIVISAATGALNSGFVEHENDLQRIALSHTQTALLFTLEANRVCNKYYEAADFRDGVFFPADSVNVTFEDITRAMDEENLTVKDLENDSLISKLDARALYIATKRQTPFKYYVQCQKLQSNSSASLQDASMAYADVRPNYFIKNLVSNIHIVSLLMSLICLIEAFRPGPLTTILSGLGSRLQV